MNILIVSNSFVVEEALGDLFNKLFTYPIIKTIPSIYEVDDDQLLNQDLIFIVINRNENHIIEKLGNTKSKNKKIKIVVLDTQKSEVAFKQAVKMDIDGYIINIESKEGFVVFINRIMQGQKTYDTAMLKSVVSLDREEALTRREKDVLSELGKGLSNKEISNNLYITEHTVKKHISNILDKLNLKNRQEAIIYIKRDQD